MKRKLVQKYLQSLRPSENTKIANSLQDVSVWGYHLDKHLDEFEQFVKIGKDSRILDVAAGTGMVGQKVHILTNISGIIIKKSISLSMSVATEIVRCERLLSGCHSESELYARVCMCVSATTLGLFELGISL